MILFVILLLKINFLSANREIILSTNTVNSPSENVVESKSTDFQLRILPSTIRYKIVADFLVRAEGAFYNVKKEIKCKKPKNSLKMELLRGPLVFAEAFQIVPIDDNGVEIVGWQKKFKYGKRIDNRGEPLEIEYLSNAEIVKMQEEIRLKVPISEQRSFLANSIIAAQPSQKSTKERLASMYQVRANVFRGRILPNGLYKLTIRMKYQKDDGNEVEERKSECTTDQQGAFACPLDKNPKVS